MSADAKTQKAKERDDKITNIKNMEREINEFRQTRERQLQEQALRMREGIVKEITDVVMEKVKANNIDLVFDKSGMSLNGVPLLLFADNVDFTTDVITVLNKPGRAQPDDHDDESGRHGRSREEALIATLDLKEHTRVKARVCFFVPMKIERIPFRRSPRPSRCARPLFRVILCGAFCSISTARAEDWQSTLTRNPPGNFPALRPLEAKYTFGWSGFTAATGAVRFSQSDAGRFQLEGTGGTIGFPRLLFKMDVNYSSVVDADSLRPIEVKQSEGYRASKIVTHLTFQANGVKSERVDGNKPAELRDFSFPHVYDLSSAALYLRSQSLKERSAYRTVVYPARNPYLVTITVLGREKITIYAGSYNAIKLDVKIQRVGKNMQLEPYKKFRRANLWISDDNDRMLLRVEAQIFVGTIFAELQSVRFENPKS